MGVSRNLPGAKTPAGGPGGGDRAAQTVAGGAGHSARLPCPGGAAGAAVGAGLRPGRRGGGPPGAVQTGTAPGGTLLTLAMGRDDSTPLLRLPSTLSAGRCRASPVRRRLAARSAAIRSPRPPFRPHRLRRLPCGRADGSRRRGTHPPAHRPAAARRRSRTLRRPGQHRRPTGHGAPGTTRAALDRDRRAARRRHPLSATPTRSDGAARAGRAHRSGAEGTAFGPIGLRMPPALFGWGLLEAVDESFIEELADPADADGNGISGRVNRVQDLAQGQARIGRFGWKAEQPTLRQQTAAALHNDMGIATSLYPDPGCAAARGADCPPEATRRRRSGKADGAPALARSPGSPPPRRPGGGARPGPVRAGRLQRLPPTGGDPLARRRGDPRARPGQGAPRHRAGRAARLSAFDVSVRRLRPIHHRFPAGFQASHQSTHTPNRRRRQCRSRWRDYQAAGRLDPKPLIPSTPHHRNIPWAPSACSTHPDRQHAQDRQADPARALRRRRRRAAPRRAGQRRAGGPLSRTDLRHAEGGRRRVPGGAGGTATGSLDRVNFTGRRVALFGLGDKFSYPRNSPTPTRHALRVDLAVDTDELDRPHGWPAASSRAGGTPAPSPTSRGGLSSRSAQRRIANSAAAKVPSIAPIQMAELAGARPKMAAW